MTMPVDTTYMDGPEPELTDEELAELRARLAQAEAQPRHVGKTPKVAIPRRHLPRKLAYVTFRLPGWDGDFTLPSRNLLTQREQQGIRRGDETVLRGIFKDAFEAVQDMTDDEVIALLEAWGEASGVTTGESNAA
jgi:hypothetical protein